MTARKTKRYSPYTLNITSQGQANNELLKQELKPYFDKNVDWESLELKIVEAIGSYHLSVKLNPNRKSRADQRTDREELIACLAELNARLHYWHIPPMVWEDAKKIYTPVQNGEQALVDEVSEILKRIQHIRDVFSQTRTPSSTVTNPGTPEVKALKVTLTNVYLNFAKQEKIDQRVNFTNDVLKIFFPEQHPARKGSD
tara:strand:- start:187785 stop:188381 length:597 start_codon:yes stop_codon:yes gene_type:complete